MNWIPVEDRLPVMDEIVLTIANDDISEHAHPYRPVEAMKIAFYSSGKWWDEAWAEPVKVDNIIHEVTHWQTLPAPPK